MICITKMTIHLQDNNKIKEKILVAPILEACYLYSRVYCPSTSIQSGVSHSSGLLTHQPYAQSKITKLLQFPKKAITIWQKLILKMEVNVKSCNREDLSQMKLINEIKSIYY